ncbi:MAG TPA: helix-turn-helix domain-containing GNAT family N-acetyltransferase [Acetobacteraceae bacterium]|nr:helix-turn-helix domain-containing GNAT family N-acetyltransferase [Acetobacteraceae bacterium]
MAHREEDDVAALRAFNRLYTARLGLLDARHEGSPFTLSEARVLYELAYRAGPTAAEIARALNIDRAQISRTLKRFVARGLVEARGDPAHGRQLLLSLTEEGRAAIAALEGSTRAAIGALLDGLARTRRRRLLAAAGAICRVFEEEAAPAVTLRGPRPGDLGLVVARQAVLYAEEYGWNQEYEALAARILADFQGSFDPARDAAWIAESDGCMVGSIFLVHGDEEGVGKLRLLYVEPEARGAGVGKMLVAVCIERARAVGYGRLVLWTNSVLAAARSIYERAGFALVAEAPHHSFGKDLIGQTWVLAL